MLFSMGFYGNIEPLLYLTC